MKTNIESSAPSLPAELLHQRELAEQLQDPTKDLGDVLKLTGFEGLSEEQRISLLEHATLEDFMSTIDIIHQKVAPDHSPEIHPTAMKTVTRTGEVAHVMAEPVERVTILAYALESAQKLIHQYRQEGGASKDVLRRCANLAGFATALAHTYENGNGRTARTIGELIENGYDPNNAEAMADLAVVTANRPDKGFRINSYVPTGEWENKANKNPFAFLDVVAQQAVPFDEASYAIAVKGSFTTPRM